MSASSRSASPTPIRLVAGLGNPGREYEHTRHNVGFMVIDALAARAGLGALAFSNAWQTLWGKSADGCLYLKPQTFMNASGRAVRAAGQFYKVAAEETLIIYDDLALPLGQVRLRKEGSSGGQNGMQSVIECLGTSAVPRLRVGIGAAGGRSMVDYVLSTFKASERQALDEAVDRAAQAVEYARAHGIEAAMNVFNRSPKAEEKAEGRRQKAERAGGPWTVDGGKAQGAAARSPRDEATEAKAQAKADTGAQTGRQFQPAAAPPAPATAAPPAPTAAAPPAPTAAAPDQPTSTSPTVD